MFKNEALEQLSAPQWAMDTISIHSKKKKNMAWVRQHACPVAQSCLTLCDPLDCGPPGSSIHGIFPSKNTGNGNPFSPPGDLPDPEIETVSPVFPALQVDSLLLSYQGSTKDYTAI